MAMSHQEMGAGYPPPASAIADYLRRSISISYLLGMVWSGRLLVLAATLAGLLYGTYQVYADGPRYTARVSIAPADSDSTAGGIGGSGAAGLVAGLTGTKNTLALPIFTQFISSISSVGVAKELSRRHNLLCRLYAGECDPVTRRWQREIGAREWFNGVLARLGGIPDPNGPRTDIDLAIYIRDAIVPETNKTNSLVTLSFTHSKPDFAAQFLSAVVSTTNDHIRAQNRETQRRYVAYLAMNAAKAANVEQRQAIDTLLLQEERRLMLTEVDIPYAAKILDGPTVIPVNNVLKRLLIFTAIGFLIGACLAVSRNLLPAKWRW